MSKDNTPYMLFGFGYSATFILPMAQGSELLNALSKAEVFTDNYGKNRNIIPITKDTLSVHLISNQEYQEIKTTQLLEGND